MQLPREQVWQVWIEKKEGPYRFSSIRSLEKKEEPTHITEKQLQES